MEADPVVDQPDVVVRIEKDMPSLAVRIVDHQVKNCHRAQALAVLLAEVEVVIFGKKRPFVWRIKRFLFNLHLLRLVRRVDIVHVHSIKLAFSVIFAKCLGGRVIFHLHELPGKIGAVLRAAIGMADCVVFCSETCAARFAGIPVRKSRVIVNAVNPDGLVGHAGDNAMRRIVMIGSINKTKGQDLLLKAFAKLTDKGYPLPDARTASPHFSRIIVAPAVLEIGT